MPREYYSIGEAAKMLGISVDTLRRWDRSGRINDRAGLEQPPNRPRPGDRPPARRPGLRPPERAQPLQRHRHRRQGRRPDRPGRDGRQRSRPAHRARHARRRRRAPAPARHGGDGDRQVDVGDGSVLREVGPVHRRKTVIRGLARCAVLPRDRSSRSGSSWCRSSRSSRTCRRAGCCTSSRIRSSPTRSSSA